MKKLVFKNWKTTLAAVLSLIATILVSVGLLSPEEAAPLEGEAFNIAEHMEGIIAGVTAIVLLFAKDPGSLDK